VSQGQLGSSVHLVAVHAIQAAWEIKTNKKVSLSVQNLVDCVGKEVPSIFDDFDYVKKNGGIDTESSYPETGQPEPCHFNPAGIGAKITNWYNVSGGDESNLARVLFQVGPVAV